MAFGATQVVPDVVESMDPVVLESKIGASFAAQILTDPDSRLVEVNVAGGGAGGVLQATIFYTTDTSANFPLVSDQLVRVFWGPDRQTVFDKLEAFYAGLPEDARTTFVDKVTMGDGIVWVDVVVYEPGGEEDEEDLELARAALLNVLGLKLEQGAEPFEEPLSPDVELERAALLERRSARAKEKETRRRARKEPVTAREPLAASQALEPSDADVEDLQEPSAAELELERRALLSRRAFRLQEKSIKRRARRGNGEPS
jgi:hypothetical protein